LQHQVNAAFYDLSGAFNLVPHFIAVKELGDFDLSGHFVC
jgi:hypothetical protein